METKTNEYTINTIKHHYKCMEEVNQKIENLRFERQSHENQISLLKVDLEKLNQHFIGMKAVCVNEDGNDFIGTCNKVIVMDSLRVKPVFLNEKGKKTGAISYEWIYNGNNSN